MVKLEIKTNHIDEAAGLLDVQRHAQRQRAGGNSHQEQSCRLAELANMVTSILFHIFLLLFISILKTLLLLLLLFYLTFLPFSQTISILCSHQEESCRLAKLANMVTSLLLLISLFHFYLHSKTLRHLHALLHITSPFSSYIFIFSQKECQD